MKKLTACGAGSRSRFLGIAGLLAVALIACTSLTGCGSPTSVPSRAESAQSEATQTNATNCATPEEVIARLDAAGYGSDAAVTVVGDTISVNPRTAQVDEAYARALSEAVLTGFVSAESVLVYSKQTGQTFTCTRAPTAAAETPTDTVPSIAVGEIIGGDSYDIAVAGGKFIKQGKSTYVALKIYVLSNSGDMMYIEGDMAVEDESGESHENSDGALEQAGLVPLDTLAYVLGEGESTGGWTAFKVDPKAKDLTLVIAADDSYESTDGEIRIPLAGFRSVPSSSNVAKLYAKAAKIGGARADAAELTMAEYRAIKNGMSVTRVNSIVGFKGEELSRYGSYVSYSWQNEDGSNMMVSFRSNRMYSKAQAGL